MRRRIFLAAVLFTSLAIAYNNCGPIQFSVKNFSTSTGNPMNPTQASQEILFALCSVLDRCQAQVPFNVCMSGILGTSGIGAQLGLAPGVDDPYSTLEATEQSGQISANPSAANTCVDSINNLQCSDPNVLNAYNASSSDPFFAVPYMVPIASCGQVFTPPVQQYACSTKIFLRGVANVPNGPQVSGPGLNYSISPGLPSGLTMDPSTGIISGTPTVVSPMTAYTVTSTDSMGRNLSAVLNVMTADGYLVNDTSDLHNVGPGCTSGSGTCTLRAAIEEINSVPSPNVVILPPGQISLTLGVLTINSGATIFGDCMANTTIDGNNSSTVLVASGGTTLLSNLIIQNGNAPGAGGLAVSGGNATLQYSTVQNNISTGAANFGGGILVNSGTLTIDHSIIQNNTAPNSTGGGVAANTGVVTVTYSSFVGNSAGSGGGMVINGKAFVSQSLFLNNSATNLGGGLYAGNDPGTGTLTNVTFYGNKSSGSGGGAIALGNGGSLALKNCTITNNTYSGVGKAGGIDIGSGGTMTISNSIVAGNNDSGGLHNCNMRTSLTSIGYNISDSSDCAFTSAGDLQNTNPLLGPLQNNGGFTFTEALLPGSPGIDSANPASCPSIDQRSYPRLIDGTCDSGAFESSF